VASQKTGELTEDRSSLDLFESESARRGWHARRLPDGLELEVLGEGKRFFAWPPIAPIRKSQIPGMTAELHHLRAVPTRRCEAELPLTFPVCVKPDLGSLGLGFQAIHDATAWRTFVRDGAHLDDFVVQPLLAGAEHRVTLCADGTFAAAGLLERRGARSRWEDWTGSVPAGWLEDLAAILDRLGVAVIGVDVMASDGVAYLLDVNLAPDLAVHLVTDSPRELAPAVLDAWRDAKT
jgi:hypothetical protein